MIRVKHWIKEVFVVAPLLFSCRFTSPDSIIKALLASAAFALASSFVYVINDLIDIECDRYHPKKKCRPIASGAIRKETAITTGVLLFVLGSIIALQINWLTALSLGVYILINIVYSLRLKKIAFIEVMILASGFLLRVIVGTVSIGVVLSRWMLLSTFFLALLLGFGKRRKELLAVTDSVAHRAVLGYYSVELLNCLIIISASLTIITYTLYTVVSKTINELGSNEFVLTVPFVVYGVFRYLYLIYRQNGGGDPAELLLRDFPLIIDIGLWISAVGGLLIYSVINGKPV